MEQCGPGLVWNQDIITCDWPENVDTSGCTMPAVIKITKPKDGHHRVPPKMKRLHRMMVPPQTQTRHAAVAPKLTPVVAKHHANVKSKKMKMSPKALGVNVPNLVKKAQQKPRH